MSLDLRDVTTAMVLDALHGTADPHDGELVATGLSASPGVASGTVATTLDQALDAYDGGCEVIFVRPETTPGDEPAMRIASAVVTERGGLASHAAVISRDLGVPAVCGAGPLQLVDGDLVTVDGATGQIRRGLGAATTAVETLPDWLVEVLEAADEAAAPFQVWANADRAETAVLARRFGARGIGLCRTEHMFLGSRAPIIGRLLDGDDAAVDEVASVMRDDVGGLLEVMDGLPVVIRLLDAPRHEFGGPEEHNPMLGVRGARLALTRPDLYRAQARAVQAAALELRSRGLDPRPRLLVPLVSLPAELETLASWVREEFGGPVGTMIETPRAALCADRLATRSDFFSFGTNDLTQLTYGWSRDDVEADLLPVYRELGVIERSPFETLDAGGVMRLVSLAVETGRAAQPGLEIGLCGEHGGDPRSVELARLAGIDHVSCSPYRVPVARLAAGHAALGIGA